MRRHVVALHIGPVEQRRAQRGKTMKATELSLTAEAAESLLIFQTRRSARSLHTSAAGLRFSRV
jgi:hypothetical protein